MLWLCLQYVTAATICNSFRGWGVKASSDYMYTVQQHLLYVVQLIKDRHTWRKTTRIITGFNGSHVHRGHEHNEEDLQHLSPPYYSTCSILGGPNDQMLRMTHKSAAHRAE